jgi:phenylalanyl-tRNA synthetase beta subunit
LDVDALTDMMVEVRRAERYSPFPAIERDLNFIAPETLQWSELESVCRSSGGELLQNVAYRETYRDAKKDGADRKRILISLAFQSFHRTLTSQEVDQAVAQIVHSCSDRLSAKLL